MAFARFIPEKPALGLGRRPGAVKSVVTGRRITQQFDDGTVQRVARLVLQTVIRCADGEADDSGGNGSRQLQPTFGRLCGSDRHDLWRHQLVENSLLDRGRRLDRLQRTMEQIERLTSFPQVSLANGAAGGEMGLELQTLGAVERA